MKLPKLRFSLSSFLMGAAVAAGFANIIVQRVWDERVGQIHNQLAIEKNGWLTARTEYENDIAVLRADYEKWIGNVKTYPRAVKFNRAFIVDVQAKVDGFGEQINRLEAWVEKIADKVDVPEPSAEF